MLRRWCDYEHRHTQTHTQTHADTHTHAKSTSNAIWERVRHIQLKATSTWYHRTARPCLHQRKATVIVISRQFNRPIALIPRPIITVKVRSHWASMLTCASVFVSNFKIVCLWRCDLDTENGYRTHSLHLRFVTILFIIFENTNTDVDAKCELAFMLLVNPFLSETETIEHSL